MQEMNLELARYNMIEQQIRPWDVPDRRVLDAIANTPREIFVAPEKASMAYMDVECPIGFDETMLEPKFEARMLQALNIQPTDHVLEIGTGSGCSAVLMAKLGHSVTSVEQHEALSQSAQAHVKAAGVDNVKLMVGDGAFGWKQDRSQYDVIAIEGSMPEYNDCFEQQLREGGRLFVVVGEAPIMVAMLITHVSNNQFTREILFDTSLKVLSGHERKPAFVL